MTNDKGKTQEQLVAEVSKLRRRIARLEKSASKLKETENQLRISLQQMRSLLDAAPDFFFFKDFDLRYRLVNKANIRFFDKEEADILGRTDFDLMQDTIIATACRESDQRAIADQKTVVTVEQVDDKIYETRKFPVVAEGRTVGVAGIVRDVTEHQRVEQALLEANRKLDEIIEYLPEATLVIDAEGKVIAWNKAMEEMSGIRASDIIGKGDYEYALPFYGERRPILIDLVLKSRKEFEQRYLTTIRRDETLVGEAYVPAIRGKEMYFSGSASILRDSKGGIVGAIETIRNITDRRKAEDKYRGIFDNAMMGIFQIGPERRILSANPAFARILGYDSPEEVVSAVSDVSQQLFVDPRHYEELREFVLHHSTINLQEVELYKKDRGTILAHTSGRVVRDGIGNILYYEGTIQDITEISRLEAQLRQAQKMEAIGTLAGGIAHDFNNILASMMGYTEMAGKETNEEYRQKYLRQISRACERAKNLVNQILSFSRRHEQEPRPLDIRLMVKETLSLLRATLPSTIEIKRDVDFEEATVMADPTQIHQVVMNLCTNAAQAMPKGGLLDVGLSVIALDEQNPFSGLPAGRYARLSVRDTGCGIDPAIQDKIFDPFFTTKKAKEGTGLGLSVVYGIVKSLGGAVDVQSLPGRGATFNVYLPCVSAVQVAGDHEPDELDLQGNENILFVDDEDMLVNMARTFFESLGYSVTATTSSPDALRLFKENPHAFNVVITDMTMPVMTGLALSRELLRLRPDLPVILCTGYSDAVNVADVHKERIREFCLKPIPLNVLGRLVRRLLDEPVRT